MINWDRIKPKNLEVEKERVTSDVDDEWKLYRGDDI